MILEFTRLKCTMYTSYSLDNFVFKLCYRWTVLLLITFSFLVTCRLLLGDSFTCITYGDELILPYMNTKCYADGVFTLPSQLIQLKNASATIGSSLQEYKRYQKYYSWVNLLFLVHAFNFYLPHLIWKSYESGYIGKLTEGVQKFVDKEENRDLQLRCLAKFILDTRGKHKLYTFLYIFCEVLNSAVCLCQMLWLTSFFGVTGVPDFLPFVIETWSDFKHFYFPSEGTCYINRHSPSGSTMRLSAECLTPLNDLYMHMYLFLHTWYTLLTTLCVLILIYRMAFLASSFRLFIAICTASLVERPVLKSLCYRMSYSDWFFITRMQKTMTDIDFTHMLEIIVSFSKGKDDNNKENNSPTLPGDDAAMNLDNLEATSPL